MKWYSNGGHRQEEVIEKHGETKQQAAKHIPTIAEIGMK
jgi:hypothetical protein